MWVTTEGFSALLRSQILQRGDLGVLHSPLGWPTPASRSILRWRLLALPGPRLIDIAHRDEAVSFDGLHRHAAAGGGPADGGAQATGALPLHQRHPDRLAGGAAVRDARGDADQAAYFSLRGRF
jgi:hypothetical protein